MRTELLVYHFLYGLHSGIPLCCVFQFCVDYIDNVPYAGEKRLRDAGLLKDGVPPFMLGIRYAPCSKCTEKIAVGEIEPAKIHRCDETCEDVIKAFPRLQRVVARRR